MANAITSQVLVDGSTVTVIKYDITADASAEFTNETLYDAAASVSESTNNRLDKIYYQLDGFSAFLDWDATADVPLISLDEGIQEEVNYRDFGGIINDAGAGKTGDINITTKGLTSGDRGYIILHLKQRGV